NVNFKEGDIISEGSILAIVDNKGNEINAQSSKDLLAIAQANINPNAPLLQQAKQSIAIAKNKMLQDQLQAARYKELWANNSVAKVEWENAELTAKTSALNYETALENYNRLAQEAKQQVISSKALTNINSEARFNNQIKAVVGGRIYKKYKEAGDYIKKGEVLATIGSALIIYAKVNIDESSIAKIKLGQNASIQLNTNKQKIFNGKVFEIAPEFDEASQSFICKIAFTDSLDFKIANTQLECNITTNTQKNALLIPKIYFSQAGTVQVKGEKAQRSITTGIISNEWVQVLGGITEKDVLVTDNIPSNNIKPSEVGSQMK
ncbi:MAG: efflux RND transporter periplasmic adaptor subunit, partial [Flexibacteraceae bacterium]